MRKIFIILCFALLSTTLFAQRQSIDVLNAERRAAEAAISKIDAQLREIEGTKKDISQQLRLVKERLSKRREVLRSIDAQISILDDREHEQSELATLHSRTLDSLFTSYEKIVGRTYLDRHQTAVSPILAPSSIRAARVHNRHIASILLQTIEAKNVKIRSIQGELGFELRDIALRKEQLALLKIDEAKAVAEVDSEKAKIERLTASVAKDEQALTTEKTRRLNAIAALQRQIEDAIRREVESSKKKPVKGEKPTVDQSDPLSRAFVASKGKMLSPVWPAKIVDRYGVHDHPTERGVKVDNKGINLLASGGAQVRSVAKGEIRKIFVVPAMGTSILVRHGAYLTVYSNLKSVEVAVGDQVAEGRTLGLVADDGVLHFELWRETQTMNPASWVKFN